MATGTYSGFIYGDGTLYGAASYTQGGAQIWIVNVDWNNDGSYDGGNEGDYLIDYNLNRGRQNYLNAQGQGFEHMPVGTCSLTLDNKDRRYDPRNTGSPLYPNVVPGRRLYVAVHDIANNVTYTRFTGIIDDIVPQTAPGGGVVRLDCVDYMQILNDQRLTSAAALVDTDITNCMESALNDANYPGTIALEYDGQPVYVFGVNDDNAGSVIHELADAALGVFFVDADGKAIFNARDHSYPAGTALDEAQCLNDPVLAQPWAEVFSYTKIMSYRVVKEQPSVIYFLSWPKQFAQSTAFTVYPRYDASTDLQISTYTANTSQDETGTDITSTTAEQSKTLNLTGGSITYQNDSNAGYLTGLEIRGRKWRLETETQDLENNPGTYRMRRFYLDSRYLQDANYMDEFVTIVDGFVSADREAISVQIEQREDLQFGFELLDTVAFTSATLDIDDTYYVLGIQEEWKTGAQGALTTLHLHKILTDSTAITGTGFFEDQAQAPLGYDNPAGDPATLAAVEESPDFEDLARDPAYIQLAMDTANGGSRAGGIIAWGPVGGDIDIDNNAATQTPKFEFPDGMYTPGTSQQNIIITKAGIWFFVLRASTYAGATVDEVTLQPRIYLYDTDASTLLKGSGSHPVNFYDPPDMTYDFFANTTTAMFDVAENQVIKCYLATNGDEDVFAVFQGWRIAAAPET